MNTDNAGLRALTTSKERAEIRVVGRCGRKRIKLQYLKRSKQMMGFALWNVLTPVDGYTYGPNSGVPTFSLDMLRAKGLI